MKTISNSENSNYVESSVAKISPTTRIMPVRLMNNIYEDFIFGKLPGRTTGVAAGYISDASITTSLILPGNPTTYPFIPSSGFSDIRMKSTSALDSASSSGSYIQIVFICNTDFEFLSEIVFLNGQTPVSLITPNIYHVYYSFPIAGGLLYNGNNLNANAGQLYIGRGNSTPTGGFDTNYAWNRINDGFTSSSIYVVPKGKKASLWSVKYNADRAVSVIFKTYVRPSRANQWSLQSEDNCATTIVIERSLIGGALDPGAEFTVVGFKTQNTANISANFVMTIYEFVDKLYQDYSANPV